MATPERADFVDRPGLHPDQLLVIAAFGAFGIVTLIWMLVASLNGHPKYAPGFPLVWPFLVATFIGFLWVMVASIRRTEYRIDDEALHIRMLLGERKIALREIASARIARSGFPNRRSSVALRLRRRWPLPEYCSQSDPGVFVAELERRAGRDLLG